MLVFGGRGGARGPRGGWNGCCAHAARRGVLRLVVGKRSSESEEGTYKGCPKCGVRGAVNSAPLRKATLLAPGRTFNGWPSTRPPTGSFTRRQREPFGSALVCARLYGGRLSWLSTQECVKAGSCVSACTRGHSWMSPSYIVHSHGRGRGPLATKTRGS